MGGRFPGAGALGYILTPLRGFRTRPRTVGHLPLNSGEHTHMGFWSKLFGGGGAAAGGGAGGGREGVNVQLPSTVVAKEFGEVNVKRRGKELEILFTILMEPTDAEGWQTGVALDASGSMLGAFGKDIEP